MGYDPMDYRYYLLGAHYRKQLAFTFEALDGARNAMKRLKISIAELKEIQSPSAIADPELLEEFHEAINDDLNTPKALAVLWKVIDSEDLSAGEKLALIEQFERVLALGLAEVESDTIPGEIEELALQRKQARKDRNWKRADELRELISEKGYEILDDRDGYKIRKK